MGSGTDIVESAKQHIVSVAGGPARLQIIAVLAAVLALEASDLGTVSTVSGQLKQAFHLGNTEVGLLLAVVSFVGAAATLPMGALVDRLSRSVQRARVRPRQELIVREDPARWSLWRVMRYLLRLPAPTAC
jgi:MFS family permease